MAKLQPIDLDLLPTIIARPVALRIVTLWSARTDTAEIARIEAEHFEEIGEAVVANVVAAYRDALHAKRTAPPQAEAVASDVPAWVFERGRPNFRNLASAFGVAHAETRIRLMQVEGRP